MQKFFSIAAIALTVGALTVACHRNNGTATDTLPTDTLGIEEVVDEIDTVAIDTVVAEEVVAPAKKKATTVKKETKPGVTTTNINTNKKPAAEAAGELKQGEGNQVETKSLGGKPSAADAFKKKN